MIIDSKIAKKTSVIASALVLFSFSGAGKAMEKHMEVLGHMCESAWTEGEITMECSVKKGKFGINWLDLRVNSKLSALRAGKLSAEDVCARLSKAFIKSNVFRGTGELWFMRIFDSYHTDADFYSGNFELATCPLWES